MPRLPKIGETDVTGKLAPISSALVASNLKVMDLTWVTNRIALGGGIWNDQNMAELVQLGVTHIINMQVEFDDRPLAQPYPIAVFHSPTEDDFQPKPPELFQPAVEFALKALERPQGKIYIHCAAGVHRAPMMTLAVLRVLGWPLHEAIDRIMDLRWVVDFADVYVESVEEFVKAYELSDGVNPRERSNPLSS